MLYDFTSRLLTFKIWQRMGKILVLHASYHSLHNTTQYNLSNIYSSKFVNINISFFYHFSHTIKHQKEHRPFTEIQLKVRINQDPKILNHFPKDYTHSHYCKG